MNTLLTYPPEAPTSAMRVIPVRRQRHLVARTALVVAAIPVGLLVGLLAVCVVVQVFPGLLLVGAR